MLQNRSFGPAFTLLALHWQCAHPLGTSPFSYPEKSCSMASVWSSDRGKLKPLLSTYSGDMEISTVVSTAYSTSGILRLFLFQTCIWGKNFSFLWIFKQSSWFFLEISASFSNLLQKAGDQTQTGKSKTTHNISTVTCTTVVHFLLLTICLFKSKLWIYSLLCILCIKVNSCWDDCLWFPDLLWK